MVLRTLLTKLTKDFTILSFEKDFSNYINEFLFSSAHLTTLGLVVLTGSLVELVCPLILDACPIVFSFEAFVCPLVVSVCPLYLKYYQGLSL